MIFGEIRDLILENQETQQRIFRGDYSKHLIFAEDVIPTLAKKRGEKEEEVEKDLEDALRYAGGLCLNIQGLSTMDFLTRECRFARNPKQKNIVQNA